MEWKRRESEGRLFAVAPFARIRGGRPRGAGKKGKKKKKGEAGEEGSRSGRGTRNVKEEEKWIKKDKSDPNMGQQTKAREAALEKYKTSDEWVDQPPKDKRFRFRFPPAPRCGQNVVEAGKLSHGYGTGKYQVLFENVDLSVDRGERIGFVGPNGSGAPCREIISPLNSFSSSVGIPQESRR